MQFGAHETMEVHECLMDKINQIAHFNLYASQARDPRLQDMIARHRHTAIMSYNELVHLTQGNTRFQPIMSNPSMQGMGGQQVQYGLHNPPQMSPQTDAKFSDQEIAAAMLICHKNGAKNATWAALECADPNLRRAIQNSAMACMNFAYEVFLLMNEQGQYQVPTLKDQTAQTFMQSYQPADQALMSQFGAAGMQGGAYGMQGGAYGMQTASNMNSMNNMNNMNFSNSTMGQYRMPQ
ncbi:spore coat protein [Cohnella candidum]|uniref:Spore coat protein n=1 Tax=Cohnella candidum TaxID=2674991 RepID=A0A3G3K1L2_9BACL|nr:spore coat protein [Cohnella candidum]AYQ74396.1 spore coat protein [Cohnella candidum]